MTSRAMRRAMLTAVLVGALTVGGPAVASAATAEAVSPHAYVVVDSTAGVPGDDDVPVPRARSLRLVTSAERAEDALQGAAPSTITPCAFNSSYICDRARSVGVLKVDLLSE